MPDGWGSAAILDEPLIGGGAGGCGPDDRFDNFNRTIFGDWGTSTDGHVWSKLLEGIVTVNVGDAGFFIMQGAGAVIITTVTDVAGPWTLSAFTVTTAFSMSKVPIDGGGYTPDLTVELRIGLERICEVEITPFAGPPYTGNPKSTLMAGPDGVITDVPPAFWVADKVYILKGVVAAGIATASVYAQDDPGTVYTAVSAVALDPNGNFSVKSNFSEGEPASPTPAPEVLTFNWIEFDYAGRPCGCGPSDRFDNFNRVFTGDPVHPNVASWGTGDTGYVWDGDSLLPTSLGVDGASAYVELESGDSAALSVNGAGAPWMTADGFVMSVHFMFDALPSLSNDQEEIDFIAGHTPGASPGFDVVISTNSSRGGLYLADDAGSDDTRYYTKLDWVASTWYTAKWEYRPGIVTRAKVWADSGTEPDWQATHVPTATAPNDKFTIQPSAAPRVADHVFYYFDWLDFTYTGKSCAGSSSPSVPDDTLSAGIQGSGIGA